MPSVACPKCGEEEALAGERVGDTLWIECERCGTRWEREALAKCLKCGSDDLRSFQEPLVQRARGNAYSIVGSTTVHLCRTCDADEIKGRLPDASKRYSAPQDP